MFLRNIHEGYLPLENADHKQRYFAVELKNFEKGKKYIKKSFLNNLGLLFGAREKIIDNFKSRLFPIKI